MKRLLPVILLICLLNSRQASAQTITPVIKANFGVEADLKRNYFNSSALPNNDDWFPGDTTGTGVFVIDTTGAAAIMAQYIADPGYRRTCFTRPMNYPIYSIVNGKFFYDAIYVRDHYKIDSTSFLNSNKNGQSPGLWLGGTTPIPDKNDINDVMVHVRRDGPNLSDSLWVFAGLSTLGNNGSRYIDFELYQTDIYYNNVTDSFYNYGPDAGHTSWKFDAFGNVTSPGDVIFTAEFGTTSLTILEARIWVDKSVLSTSPVPFSWGGAFDGDGTAAQFGYASILPKTGGNFYSGSLSIAGTWAGPFGFVDVNDITSTTYLDRNYMEIAVNMTKIGLDPYTLLGSAGCDLSFRKFFAKTRSSNAFTSSLKDFVGPYTIARPSPAQIKGDGNMFCGKVSDTSYLTVSNPISSSIYTWTTTDGLILSVPASGPTIMVGSPGKYIVTQKLFNVCAPYSSDTIILKRDDNGCLILASADINFKGKLDNSLVLLNWRSSSEDISNFIVERSFDGRNFQAISSMRPPNRGSADINYESRDNVSSFDGRTVYYRIKLVWNNSTVSYSRVISFKVENVSGIDFSISPNPANSYLSIVPVSNKSAKMMVQLFNNTGSEVIRTSLENGNERVSVDKLPPGIYFVVVSSENGLYKTQKKIIVAR